MTSALTITGAQYTNAAHTGSVIVTEEAGAVFITEADAELWAQMLTLGPAAAPALEQAVPAAVTQRQARLALHAAGLLAGVDAAIAAMPGDQGAVARIEWEHASTIDRNSPLVASMGSLLDMDAAALDELFRQAAAL